MNICMKTKNLSFRPSIISKIIHFSTSSEVVGQNDQVLVDDTDDLKAREEEIDRKRNVSRLSEAHLNLVNGRQPYEAPKCLAHLTVKYHRKMYGRYGSASGVNPSICWPSKSDIEAQKEYELVAFPYTIQEMMVTVAEKRKQEKLAIEEREKEVAAKYAKLAQLKKELSDRVNKKATEAIIAKEKKERLVEEVRRHFGFKLDPRDDRFKEMLAKREKEQKKLEKQAKREAKEKEMLAKLQQNSVELSGQAKGQIS